jgi:hypothetical protein
MTGKELLDALKKLSPEELALNCVHIHTEYSNAEDSYGYEVEQDIDSLHVETKKNRLRIGY